MINSTYPFSLPLFPYNYSDFEPYIDAQTMEIHYEKHFKSYIDKLNNELKKCERLQHLTLYEILTVPYLHYGNAYLDLLRSAGGTFNHYFYFNNIIPPSSNYHIDDNLMLKINKTFGSYEFFKKEFIREAMGVFGSGYTYLVLDKRQNLRIVSVKNQCTPLINRYDPIACIDLWEHAYYLKYKNEKLNYIVNFFNIMKFNV